MDGPQDDERVTGRLVAVALLGLLLFIPPLLSAFDRGGQVFGVPTIWAYLFVTWAVVIGLVAAVSGRSR
jgi:hypothetical protein